MTVKPEAIIELRKERGWTQAKLAIVAGLSERTIQRIEKDGTCSLDTKVALSSVFGVSPAELTSDNNKHSEVQVTYKTSWGGVIGLGVLGLVAPILALLTSVWQLWELASFGIVITFTILQSFIAFGLVATYQIFDNTSWVVRTPSFVPGLAHKILIANAIIRYAYFSGFIAATMAALTLSVHAKPILDSPVEFLQIVSRPIFYSALFAELWFRPFKSKLESMLAKQQS